MNQKETSAAERYINAIIDKSYSWSSNDSSSQCSISQIKVRFTTYLTAKSNAIGTKTLASYLKEYEAVGATFVTTLSTESEKAKEVSTLPTYPQKIEDPDTFLKGKIDLKGFIGNGAFGDVYDVLIPEAKGSYVYKIEKKLQPLTKKTEGKWWRQGDVAASKREIARMVKPVFFILAVKEKNLPDDYFYVPADQATEFGKKLQEQRPNGLVAVHSQLITKARGVGLDQLIDNSFAFPPESNAFKSIAIGVGSFLEESFPRNFVHRDIKPANLVCDLTSDMSKPDPSKVTVLDYGLSTLLARRGKTQPLKRESNPIASQKFAGTLGYMSPRVFRSQSYGSEVDFFSYGMTLLELIDPQDVNQFYNIRFGHKDGKRIDHLQDSSKYNVLNTYIASINQVKSERSNTAMIFNRPKNQQLKQLIDLSFKVSQGGPNLDANFKKWKSLFHAYREKAMRPVPA